MPAYETLFPTHLKHAFILQLRMSGEIHFRPFLSQSHA